MTDKAVVREQRLETFRQTEVSGSIHTYQERLHRTETDLAQSRQEVADLQTKLEEAKMRTKKLTEILLSGEMKEKTEVLVELHKLEKIREELSSSLAESSTLLEQERSLTTHLETKIRKAAAGARPGELELCTRLMAILRHYNKLPVSN